MSLIGYERGTALPTPYSLFALASWPRPIAAFVDGIKKKALNQTRSGKRPYPRPSWRLP
jgi:hypothetical protein